MIQRGCQFNMYKKLHYFTHDIEHTYKKGIKFIHDKFIELLKIWNQIFSTVFNYGEFAIIKSQAGLNSNKINFKLEKG